MKRSWHISRYFSAAMFSEQTGEIRENAVRVCSLINLIIILIKKGARGSVVG
jgi:hypothetical protein